MYLIMNDYPDMYKIMRMIVKKEKLLAIDCDLILLSCLTDKFCYTEMTHLLRFTINVRKSHQLQFTLQFVCEICVFVVC
jgi:hypothetical protein